VSSALAPLAQFSIKLFAGYTSDKVKFLSETNKLRVYNSIAFCGCGLFMVILAFFPTSMPYVCLLLFGAAAGTLGFTTGGRLLCRDIITAYLQASLKVDH
jgi:hypothetical protein